MTKQTNIKLTRVLKYSWFLIPLAGALQYFLIQRALVQDYFTMPINIFILGFLPAASFMYAGIIVGYRATQNLK